jgi:hypothetical protein
MTTKTSTVEAEELPEPIRRAIVRTHLRVTLPLWIGVVAACSVAVGSLLWNLHRAEDVRRERCAAVNSGQEYARRDNHGIFAGLRVDFPDATETIDHLEATQSTPALADIDCNADGWLTRNEYLYIAPAGLPLEKIPNPTEEP